MLIAAVIWFFKQFSVCILHVALQFYMHKAVLKVYTKLQKSVRFLKKIILLFSMYLMQLFKIDIFNIIIDIYFK